MESNKKQIGNKYDKSVNHVSIVNSEIVISEEMQRITVHFGLIMQLENSKHLHN